MTKRPTDALTPSQARKRRRNKLSASIAMLDSLRVSPGSAHSSAHSSAHRMTIWNSNTEAPGVVRKSVIPLPTDTSTLQHKHPALEQADNPFVGIATRPAWRQKQGSTRRKQAPKQRNDSVSPQSHFRILRLNDLPRRQKCLVGSVIGCRFSTKSYGMTAFTGTPRLLFALTASTTLACTGV